MTQSTEAVDPAIYNNFLSGVDLRGVQYTKISAERLSPGPSEEVEASVAGQVSVEEGHLLYQFDVSLDLRDGEGGAAGRIEGVLALSFAYEGDEPSKAIVDRFSGTTVSLVAYPYIREGLQSAAARIGFQGVTLPLTYAPPGGQ